MDSKRIKCPKCGGIIEVINSQNKSVLLVTCPNPVCDAKLRINFETGETQLPNSMPNKEGFYIICHGKSFLLETGANVIGRKSKTAVVDIAIDTDDKTMSRVHAEIKIVKLQSGKVKAVLRDIRNDKRKSDELPLKVNGKSLCSVDEIVLEHGDRLTLGNSTLRFVKN